MRVWLTALLAALALPAAASAGTGTPCLQNSCNGLDPTQSYNQSTGVECSSGASTAYHALSVLRDPLTRDTRVIYATDRDISTVLGSNHPDANDIY